MRREHEPNARGPHARPSIATQQTLCCSGRNSDLSLELLSYRARTLLPTHSLWLKHDSLTLSDYPHWDDEVFDVRVSRDSGKQAPAHGVHGAVGPHHRIQV